MTTPHCARGAARRFFSFFSSSFSSPFFLFLSKRLHNNRPYCDHGAPLNLNYYAQEEVFLPSLPSLSCESLSITCDIKRILLPRGWCRSGFLFFLLFLLSCFERQHRNHQNDRNAIEYFQNFYESSTIRALIQHVYLSNAYLVLNWF